MNDERHEEKRWRNVEVNITNKSLVSCKGKSKEIHTLIAVKTTIPWEGERERPPHSFLLDCRLTYWENEKRKERRERNKRRDRSEKLRKKYETKWNAERRGKEIATPMSGGICLMRGILWVPSLHSRPCRCNRDCNRKGEWGRVKLSKTEVGM